MADNAITLQGLSAITRFIGRSTFQTQDQHLVLGWFVITTNHPLKSWAVWLFPGTSLEKEPPRVCPLERDDSSRAGTGKQVRAVRRFLGHKTLKPSAVQWIYNRALGDSGVTKAGSLNQGFAAPNGRYHLRRGVINHSVRAHLCLRLGAGSEICRQLRSQGKLLDPMVWSVLHLHAEPVGFPWGIHQTKGWTLVGSHRAPRRTTRFFDVLTARVFQEKKS